MHNAADAVTVQWDKDGGEAAIGGACVRVLRLIVDNFVGRAGLIPFLYILNP